MLPVGTPWLASHVSDGYGINADSVLACLSSNAGCSQEVIVFWNFFQKWHPQPPLLMVQHVAEVALPFKICWELNIWLYHPMYV